MTWRNLSVLLDGVAPDRVFLTNAHLALFGSSPSFRSADTPFLVACEKLLRDQIETVRPSLVVCLGAPAARRLAVTTDGLSRW